MAFVCRKTCGEIFVGIPVDSSCAISAYFWTMYVTPERVNLCLRPFQNSGSSGVARRSIWFSWRYPCNNPAVCFISGTVRTFPPFPCNVITAGKSNRMSRRRIFTSSLTRAAVSYRTVSRTRCLRPFFVETSGMDNRSFKFSGVIYLACGVGATILGILRIWRQCSI